MNVKIKLSYWISYVMLIHQVGSLILEETVNTTNKNHLHTTLKATFRVTDNKKFTFHDGFCLRSVMVRTYITNDTFEGENKPGMRLGIVWEADENITYLNVESDSLDDHYCEAKDRFSYHRKPVMNNMHVFPDLVNYGSRYIPIKLDCKYNIVPEFAHPCSPLRLEYVTPVCLSESICSCRNTFLPEPKLTVSPEASGVTVHWEVGEPTNIEEIKKIYICITAAHASLTFNPDEFKPKEFSTELWRDLATKSGRHYFELNTTSTRSYMLRALYENIFQCSGNVSELIFDYPPMSHGSNQIILYTSIYLVVIVLLAVVLFYFFRQKIKHSHCDEILCARTVRPTQTVDNNESLFTVPELLGLTYANNPFYSGNFHEDLCIINFQDLILKRKLGEGHFGVVYLAYSSKDIKGHKMFAVKQLKESATRMDVEDFMEEMNTFRIAGAHPNIVSMIGCCKAPQPLSIVMEYVPYNLLEYLKNLREEFELNSVQLCTDNSAKIKYLRKSKISLPLNYVFVNDVEAAPLRQAKEELDCVLDNQELEHFALQIARGMAYLEGKKIVHRDLAARNILIDNFKTLKITDFGLSRTGIYVNKSNRQFPLRWMSPEAITRGIFSNKSDVWSYGIVLWEIGTLGGFPYPDLQNDEVFVTIKKGGHPDQPKCITAPLYDLMLNCWSIEPEDRPAFSQVVKTIEDLRRKAYVDFDTLQKCYVFPPTEEDLR